MSRIVTYSSFCLFLCISVSISYIIAMPLALTESAYGKFLTFLLENKCKMPDSIEFPFSDGTEQHPFDSLFSPLKECQTAEALKEGEEVYLLCKEIFEVLQNITCWGYSSPTKINNTIFSDDVCTDIQKLKDVLPKETEYLSGKLGDHLVCRILCSNKYESLCKVLLWSYDVQAKLQSSSTNNLEESGKVEQKDIKSNEDVSSGNNSINQKTENNSGLPDTEHIIDEKMDVNNGKLVDKLDDTTKQPSHVGIDKTSLKPLLNKTGVIATSSGTLSKISKPVNSTQLDKKNDVITGNKISTKMSKPSLESKDNLNPTLEANNEINVAEVQNKEIKADVSSKKKQKISEVENTHNELNLESVTTANSLKDNPNLVSLADNLPQKPATKLQNNATSSDVKNELKKPVEQSTEINGNKYQEKGESKTKVQTDSSKITEKEKLNEDITHKEANDLTNDNSKLLPEITTQQNFDKTEDAEGQDEKEQELYNDTENDADYPKSDFENSFSPSSKSKEPDFKSVINVVNDIGANEISSNYDGFLISRNNMGRGSDDSIQVIPSFPEQEDSHFFFYFLSIILILMAGYLIFHNKQKIIALIVEGRHERRRRSHGAGYKKLETK